METVKIQLFQGDVSLLEENKEFLKQHFPKFKILHKRFIPKTSLEDRIDDEPFYELEIRIQSMNNFWALAKTIERIHQRKQQKQAV